MMYRSNVISSIGRVLNFFFNDTATTEIYTLSLHDALPISEPSRLPATARQIRKTRCTGPRHTRALRAPSAPRSEEHTSELQSPDHLVCRLLLEKKKSSTASSRASSRLCASAPPPAP